LREVASKGFASNRAVVEFFTKPIKAGRFAIIANGEPSGPRVVPRNEGMIVPFGGNELPGGKNAKRGGC